MSGKRIMITAGPTYEKIDPVRFIGNYSSGKMGFSLAEECVRRGAEVTLIAGPVALSCSPSIHRIDVESAKEMFEAVTTRSAEADVVIMCSAVADYTPAVYADQKVKKHDGELTIELKRTQDILGWLGEHKPANQTLVGFSMETENLIENSRAKLLKKHADLICANSIAGGNTGFAVDTNKVTLIGPEAVKELPLCSKEETANLIIDHIQTLC